MVEASLIQYFSHLKIGSQDVEKLCLIEKRQDYK